MNGGAGLAMADAQILIVDDNQDAAMSLVMLFDLEDIPAATAGDALAALALVEEACPRVMLIDIGLPGMNGFELARRLRSHPIAASATLIALTGRAAGDANDPETAVFDQFWTKPFDPKRLLAEVKSLLARTPTPA